jgi:hypothetical protein
MIAVAKPNLSDAEYRELEELFTNSGEIFAMDSSDFGGATESTTLYIWKRSH